MAAIEKIGKVSSASVEKCTGKNWERWVALLEKAGARGLEHREIVALLKKKYKLSPWWQQGVATGYEMHIGRKVEGRNAKGQYSTVASRTFALSNKELWKYLESEDGLAVWLKPLSSFRFAPGETFEVDGGIFGEVRTLRKAERMRLRWQDGDWPKPSVVNLAVIPRPGKKCILVFQHDQLPSERARAAMNAHWKKILIALLEALA
jgi:uncharacterized protein YndB with AHSA1/START domain